MFPFNEISVDFDTPTEAFQSTRSLFTTKPSSETSSTGQLEINGKISSALLIRKPPLIIIGTPTESSSNMNSESGLHENPPINLETPSELLIHKRASNNSETIMNSHLSVNPELSQGSLIRRRSWNNQSIEGDSSTWTNSQPISESFLRINSEPVVKTSSLDGRPISFEKISHSSINQIPSQTLTRQRSSINLEGLANLFGSRCSSIHFRPESGIDLQRISSIHSEKSPELEDKDRDGALMQQMGYTQELKRGFSGLMSFTFCFTVVSVFPSISIGLDFGLATGGSGLLVWSWLIGSLFNILVGLSLSEICSTYPNSGSVYYWTGQLAPRRFAPLAAYICGWCSYIGNVGGTAAFASGFASIMNAAVKLGAASGNSTSGINDVPHQLVLNNRIQAAIAIGVVIIWILQNALKIDQQGWLNNLAAFIQGASTIGIVVTILVLSKNRTSAYDVFIVTNNSTGFSFAYVCLIGILPTLFSFSGFESAGHLTEETREADRKAPLAISGTCISAALIGFVYLLSILFACGNPIDLLNKQLNPSATVQIFQTSTPFPVALLFTVLLIVCLYFAGVSATTVSSRTGYAMARDSLFPYSKYLTKIYQRTQTPLGSVILVGVLNILLLLLQLFSTTAFAAIVSISTIGFQISYVLPIIFRCTTSRKTFKKGKLHMGKYGVPIGIISSIWLLVTCVILLFPFNYPITAENMNWTIVVCSGITIFAGLYWIFSVRRWFTGPPRMADVEVTSSAERI